MSPFPRVSMKLCVPLGVCVAEHSLQTFAEPEFIVLGRSHPPVPSGRSPEFRGGKGERPH